MLSRDQLDIMPMSKQLARPIMRTCATFNADHRGWHVGKCTEHVATRQHAFQNNFAMCISTNRNKHVLGNIQTDYFCSSIHGGLPLLIVACQPIWHAWHIMMPLLGGWSPFHYFKFRFLRRPLVWSIASLIPCDSVLIATLKQTLSSNTSYA